MQTIFDEKDDNEAVRDRSLHHSQSGPDAGKGHQQRDLKTLFPELYRADVSAPVSQQR